MRVLDSFKIQHKCDECCLRSSAFFCSLSDSSLKAFEALKVTNAYAKGTTLYIEGQPSNGVYVICQGRVKLSTYSRDGKALILRIAGPGDVLGLSATVSESVHESTAEVLDACQVNFVRKAEFLNFLEHNAEAGLSAVKQISHDYHKAHAQICSLGLSASVADKLAKLFLEWSENSSPNGSIRLKMLFTHEEIAEMIGTSRETVTRLLKDFRERDLITMKGSDLYIHDRKRLEAAIGTRVKGRDHL